MLVPRERARPLDLHGLRVSDYGTIGEAKASAAMVEIPPGAKGPWVRCSGRDSSYLVLGGRVEFNVDGVLYRARKGDLLVVPTGVVFRYANWWGKGARMVVLHVPACNPEEAEVLPDELRKHDVRLAGERVTLRPMTEKDWEHVLPWNADPEVLIWSDDTEEPRPTEETKDIYRSVSQFAHVFIIEHEGQPIGECWLQKMNLPGIIERFPGKDLRRIDITIGRKDLWGKGLGTDAIRTLVRFGFEEEKANGIFGMVDFKNTRSWRAFEKAGFGEFEKRGQDTGLVVWREQAAQHG